MFLLRRLLHVLLNTKLRKGIYLLWEADAGAVLPTSKTSAALTSISKLFTLGGPILDIYFRMRWSAFVEWCSPLAVKAACGNEFRYQCGDKLYNNSRLHSCCRTIAYEVANCQLRINFEWIKRRRVVGQSEYKSEWCLGSVVIALAVKCRDFFFLDPLLLFYMWRSTFSIGMDLWSRNQAGKLMHFCERLSAQQTKSELKGLQGLLLVGNIFSWGMLALLLSGPKGRKYMMHIILSMSSPVVRWRYSSM